jgi:lipopolysaccharide transport system ATP-binding protein
MSCEAPPPPILEVQSVAKAYRVYRRPQDRLLQALLRPRTPRWQELWALHNVHFEVARGEAVGILGRNGAGKSTLLQLIAGTVAPTRGRVLVRGRIAALLQLGNGFHPDYSGRENVYMAGVIQGLSRAEIDARFEEIAAFADIGSYIDRPVKTYSTGMHARLAFAVAITCDPEILIVDEVLAVGDLLFQQKCITRIQQMRERGMTLLFVSHAVDRVAGLCDKALWIEEGRQRFFGPAAEGTELYLRSLRSEPARRPAPAARAAQAAADSELVRRQTRGVSRYGSQEVRITDVRVLDGHGAPRQEFHFLEEIVIEVDWASATHSERFNVSFLVRDETGINLTGTMTWDEGVVLPPVRPGDTGTVRFRFFNRLRPGRFGISVALTEIPLEDPRKPLLFDQIDGVSGFVVLADPKRPVHYKFDSDVRIEIP